MQQHAPPCQNGGHHVAGTPADMPNMCRENSGVRPATVAPALPSTAPATLPAPEPVAAKPAIKSPPKLAELRARISGAAAPAR